MKYAKKPCTKCGKHPRLKGMLYCAECKAEAIKLYREKKRIYQRSYDAAKRAAKEAAQATAIAEAAAEMVKNTPQAASGQWTTTSITTFTTNGDNPPTVHTETKTEPAAGVKVCTKCGKAPRVKGHHTLCKDCLREYKRAWREKHKEEANKYYRDRYEKQRIEATTGHRTGSFAKPCTKCGKGPRMVGHTTCRDCWNAYLRARAAKRREENNAGAIIVQQNIQNNAPTVIPENVDIPITPKETPLVVQQNIQNNSPAESVPSKDTLNVNVTNPIKVDVQHSNESSQHLWLGYFMAVAFFLLWLGHIAKNWFK